MTKLIFKVVRYQRLSRESPYVCKLQHLPIDGKPVLSHRICNRQFIERTNYLNHIRVHTGQRPFKCGEKACQMSFKTLGQRMNHSLRHTDNKAWKCTLCPKTFYRKVELQQHM